MNPASAVFRMCGEATSAIPGRIRGWSMDALNSMTLVGVDVIALRRAVLDTMESAGTTTAIAGE